MERNSGICQRLINFILRTMRRPSDLPVSVPVESADGASLHSQIQVDFRHQDPKKDDDGLVVVSHDKNGSNRKGTGVKKTVSIMDSAKKKNEAAADDDETKPKTPPRLHWPLLSVEANINEKSDAYISSRKKAMRRNYTLDQQSHGQ